MNISDKKQSLWVLFIMLCIPVLTAGPRFVQRVVIFNNRYEAGKLKMHIGRNVFYHPGYFSRLCIVNRECFAQHVCPVEIFSGDRLRDHNRIGFRQRGFGVTSNHG